MEALTQMKCVACRADSLKVTEAEIAEFKPQVPDWELVERGLERGASGVTPTMWNNATVPDEAAAAPKALS